MAEYGYSELDVLYSPRFWVSRMHESVVVETHIKITGEASALVRKEIPYEANVRYGPNPAELMDIFGGDTVPRDAPIFVYIHGGYWQHLNKEMSCNAVQPLVRAGIRVAVVGYDLAPNVKMSEMVEEIKRAGTFIVKMAEDLGSRGVWISGFSAGGHFTGVLLASKWLDTLSPNQQSLIKGFIPISGIFDLIPIVKTYINGPLKMDNEEALAHSPARMTTLKKRNVKVIVILGQYDSPEFHNQSENFTKVLKEKGLDVIHYVVPDMDHFNLVENLSQADYVLSKKLVHIVTQGHF